MMSTMMMNAVNEAKLRLGEGKARGGGMIRKGANLRSVRGAVEMGHSFGYVITTQCRVTMP